jgi:hypothetical protein
MRATGHDRCVATNAKPSAVKQAVILVRALEDAVAREPTQVVIDPEGVER